MLALAAERTIQSAFAVACAATAHLAHKNSLKLVNPKKPVSLPAFPVLNKPCIPPPDCLDVPIYTRSGRYVSMVSKQDTKID
jgi:hypothetical protein